MTQDEKNESYLLNYNYIRGYLKLTDETLKRIENLKFNNPILIISKDKQQVEDAEKYIHTVIENPYLPDNLSPSVEKIKLKGHLEEKSRGDLDIGLMQRVVNAIGKIKEEDYHKTILKKYSDKRETELKEYSCIGKNETEIENDLFLSNNALIKHHQRDEMLFVKGLKSQRILDRLADIFSSLRFRVLIINVPSMDIIPQELKDQFEVINLDPEKQDKTTDTPKKINKLFYSWNKENKFVLYSKKDKPVELTKKESELILYLKEDRRTPEEIIEHLWGVYKTKDVRKKKNNIMELRNRLNMKCSKIGIENLISTLIDGCYCLNLEVEER